MITRRQFGAASLLLAARPAPFFGATNAIDDVLRNGIASRGIPCVTAMVASADAITYTGAFGARDSASGMKVKPDSIFMIASMTKAITSTAAMQLVEQGKVSLEEPVSKHIPDFEKLQVLERFDGDKPVLRPVRTPVTLRHLLTHTSGFSYDTWSEKMFKYVAASGAQIGPSTPAPQVPLMFEPGTQWQYGYGVDWTGKLVETVSGLTLEQYFVRNILDPLGMSDTRYSVPEEKFERFVNMYRRQPDGSLKEDPRSRPSPPKTFNGGGGLYSTAGDYVKFMQMILRKGRSSGGDQILKAATVENMEKNHIGQLGAGKMKTSRPDTSSDGDFHPGAVDKFGLGFLINETAHDGGRAAGSLAWAGVANTYYWIDPRSNLCAAIMMQYFPFVDKEAVGLLGDFERAVYANRKA